VGDPPSGQASQRLVVLDFSGTLSIAAGRFGQPASIESAVQECGLADQGVDARLLWSEIILPSWHETITTRRGYEGVLTDAAMTVLSARGRPTDRVADGIAAFTRRYLAANRIAPEWRPWLRRFTTLRVTRVIVATDHAAEATAQISSDLTVLGVDNAAVAQASATDARCLIANSADLGSRKSGQLFWQKVRHALPARRVTHVIVVDDFGANEHSAHNAITAELNNDLTRQLSAVFGVTPVVLAFALPDDVLCSGDGFRRCVDQAGDFVLRALNL